MQNSDFVCNFFYSSIFSTLTIYIYQAIYRKDFNSIPSVRMYQGVEVPRPHGVLLQVLPRGAAVDGRHVRVSNGHRGRGGARLHA